MKKRRKLNTANQKSYRANRKHKDGLFRITFREKKDLLELYNAINGSDYQDPEELTVYTLEDAVYISMKNDISFLLGEMLSLYEHQSTENPNLPMRGLLYFARNYESYIEQNGMDIYGSTLQKFPLPQYYVFYNGLQDEPDSRMMELKDAFPVIEGKEPCLNCRAVLLNINYGHNAALMDRCKRLHDYAAFIHRIRQNQTAGATLTEAVDQAIDDCIEQDILADILVKCRAEVREMVLSTYNKEAYERNMKTAAYEEGRAEGLEVGHASGLAEGLETGHTELLIQLVCKKLRKGKSPQIIAEELEAELSSIEKLCEIARQYAPEYDCEKIREHMKKQKETE